MTVAVVTDSTASLRSAPGLAVVPLTVLVGDQAFQEGLDLGPAGLVTALRSGARVTTSQPAPADFSDAYWQLLSAGATEVVSIHLSGALSGTVAAAEIAAKDVPVPVTVVDSRSVAGGLRRAALAAAAVAQRGADAATVARVAREAAAGARMWFAVDTLEYLRAGGRMGPVQAAIGTALGVRPVLGLVDGQLTVVEKVRTSKRTRERVIEHALADAAGREHPVVVVHHLGTPEVAAETADRIRGAGFASVEVTELSAVLGAHVGPGVLAVVVADV